jgi:hypothetical protein
MTKAAACLDSNGFWMTPLPLEKSSQTVRKGGPLPSPAVHYTQQQQRQRLLLRVFLVVCCQLSARDFGRGDLLYNGHHEKKSVFYQCCESGMFIPDPGSNNKKEEAGKFVVLYFL